MIAIGVFTVCAVVLLVYLFDFIKFVKNDNRKEYIQSLNETVQKMLSYKKRTKSKIILDVDHDQDYSNLENKNINDITDSKIEEILSNRLSYTESLDTWIVKRT